MDTLLDVSSGLFLLMGSFLCLTGGLGILRFPDFYTRMHAVGVTDTLATAMILIGLILHNPDFMVDVKLMFILLMVIFISPTASHALANAAMYDELSVQKNSQSDSE
jgi:multicomponent Na+:H+ antiporter subunit G